jgi:hypothetical protein
VPSGDFFFGVIRGTDITEVGVEYYVEVENSGVFDTDPSGAPDDSTFFQAVSSPTTIDTDVVSATGPDLFEGQSVIVQVLLPEGAVFSSGILHHREGGASAYEQVPIELKGFLPEATIPGASVGARGLEYWVEVATATATLTDPASDPSVSPRQIQVTVPRLEEPFSHAGERYRLLSVPMDFGTSSETIEALLSDQPEFGLYDPNRWQAWTWVNGEDRYAGIGDRAASDYLRPIPGRAFWLVSRAAHRVDTAPLVGKSTATQEPYEVILPPGWTMLGHPFNFPVSWETVLADDLFSGPFRWVPEENDYDYEPAAILEPFEGYWIHNAASDVARLRIPPIESDAPAGALAATARSDFGWRTTLRATTVTGASAEIALGVHQRARDAYDPLDRLALPSAPGSWVRLGARHDDWLLRSGLYRRDVRAPDRDGHRFDLELRTSAVEAVNLAAALEQTAGWTVRLIDTEQSLGLPREHEIVSFGPDRTYHLTLLVGTDEFVSRETGILVHLPATLVLDQSSPNPFRAAARIRFGLPAPGRARLDIFDVVGRRVVTLVDEDLSAGYHTEIWDGRDSGGIRTAAGVYFYRFTTPAGSLTRKLARVR